MINHVSHLGCDFFFDLVGDGFAIDDFGIHVIIV